MKGLRTTASVISMVFAVIGFSVLISEFGRNMGDLSDLPTVVQVVMTVTILLMLVIGTVAILLGIVIPAVEGIDK